MFNRAYAGYAVVQLRLRQGIRNFMATTESICPQHRARSMDFVALNSKPATWRCETCRHEWEQYGRPRGCPYCAGLLLTRQVKEARARLAKARTK